MDDFTWLAHLDNGDAYPEHDARGVARGWRDVPHARVTALELVPQRPHLHRVHWEIPRGAVPVLFRRRTVRVHLRTDGHIEDGGTITVLGWESSDAARYVAVWPNGDTRITETTAVIQ